MKGRWRWMLLLPLLLLAVPVACSSGATLPPVDGGEDAAASGDGDGGVAGDDGHADADLPPADDGGDAGRDAGGDPGVDGGGDEGADQGPLFTVLPGEDFDDADLRVSIFFSPVDDTRQQVLDYLAAAQHSLHLAFFNVRLQEVGDLLVAQHQAGLDVHLLMDRKQMDKSYNTMDDWLLEQGVPVTGILNDSAADATMHDKFTIVDSRWVLTGSLNYSATAFTRSEEDLWVIDDPALAALYQQEFDELLAGQQVPGTPDPQADLQVYFGPEDRLDLATVAAIDDARRDVEVIMFSAGLADLTDALVAAVGRGVRAVLLIDRRQSEDTGADETMEAAGVHVLRVDRSFPVELHHKLCVVDGTWVLGGSYNWTPLASFHNDENLLKVRSPALATRVLERLLQIAAAEDTSFSPAGYGWTAGSRTVTFTVVNLQVRADGAVYLLGDVPELGGMDASRAVAMQREILPDGERWSATVQLDAGATVNYGYLVRGPGGINNREGGPARTFTVPYPEEDYRLFDTFRQ